MAVRVKLLIKVNGKTKEVVALVNSGYEADSPQLMIPHGIARELGLWPPPTASRELVYDTAGGPVKVWLIPSVAKAKVVAEDQVSSKEVLIDLVVSTYVDEPLISDALASAFEIVIEDPYRGLWRFKWEDKVRESVKK